MATFVMLAAVVFGAADGCLARTNEALALLPDDTARLLFVGAGGLGFLIGAFHKD